MAREGGGREGDWECCGCNNRNYAFRSFCNRCKKPRLLVDTKTPADSKWRPRIGDWICSGCTNNNYASREICKKCGQQKEVAAMPAVAIPGASVPTHPTYFARSQGGVDQMMNIGLLRQSLAFSSSFPVGDADRYRIQSTAPYGIQQAPTWSFGGNTTSGLPISAQTNEIPPIPNGNGWRAGDWMCKCGFHNYSSRTECKKCNAPKPAGTPSSIVSSATTALGTKRVASEEIEHWEHKRLNAGQAYGLHQSYPGYGSFPGIYPAIPNQSTLIDPNLQVIHHLTRALGAPALLGKGAGEWRDGDWMCTNCNNHNYASRDQCNKCKTQRELAQTGPRSRNSVDL